MDESSSTDGSHGLIGTGKMDFASYTLLFLVPLDDILGFLMSRQEDSFTLEPLSFYASGIQHGVMGEKGVLFA